MLSTTEIGKKLERDFGKFMEDKLGYNVVEYNIPMNGKVSERYYDCDIHGIRGGGMFDKLRNFGIACAVIAGITFLFELGDIEAIVEEFFAGISPSLAGSGLLILGSVGIVLGVLGKRHQVQHTWVECKELKTNVMRDHIVKLKEAVSDVSKVEDAKWKAETTILVSKSGFDVDTINFAREFEIELYQRKGPSFELVG